MMPVINGRGINWNDTSMPAPVESLTTCVAGFHEDQGNVAIRRWFIPRTAWVYEGIVITTGIDEAFA